MPAKFDRAVKHIMAKGKSKSSAYAIATAAMQKSKKTTKRKPRK